MLAKRIPVQDLRPGMYIHKLGGSWLKHPFLRGSFLLTDPADIRAIMEAGIREVWIKSTAGCTRPEGRSEAPPDAPEAPALTGVSPPVETCDSTSPMASEVARAKDICLSAKGQIVEMFNEARLGKAIDPNATLPLVDEIASSIERHPIALLSVARLKTHDDYTYLHSVAVCALMLSLARQLRLSEEHTRLAGIGGLMHDLGKAAMPLDVLNKPGKLTDAEFEIMKGHPAAGAELLRAGGAAPEVQEIALYHHEKMNGQGYPHGLAGNEIPLLARMGAICDVYDAVTSQRAYKEPWNPAGAMRQMASWDGHFDKVLFNAFVKSVGIYPVGSLVRLASQRLAVVTEPGRDSLLRPTVRVFFSLLDNEPIPMHLLDLGAPCCEDSIIGPEDENRWHFRHLDDMCLWLK